MSPDRPEQQIFSRAGSRQRVDSRADSRGIRLRGAAGDRRMFRVLGVAPPAPLRLARGPRHCVSRRIRGCTHSRRNGVCGTGLCRVRKRVHRGVARVDVEDRRNSAGPMGSCRSDDLFDRRRCDCLRPALILERESSYLIRFKRVREYTSNGLPAAASSNTSSISSGPLIRYVSFAL